MFDVARISSGSKASGRMQAAAAASAALMVVALPATGHAQEGGNDEVTLCHETGDGTYETITVSDSGADNGHEGHAGDIIPAPAEGCPTDTPPPDTPAPSNGTPAEPDKVLVCHLTASGEYTLIDIADEGWENGHDAHEGDILLLDGAGTESCPDARAALDGAATAGVDVAALVPGASNTAPQDGRVTICHRTSDGYVKITIAEEGWENGHSEHEGDIMLTGSSVSAVCADAASALAAVASGGPSVRGIDAASLVAADPDLPNAGAAHTLMLAIATVALLSGLWMVRVSKDPIAS